MILPPCPSCGTTLVVSSTAPPPDPKCPRCGVALAQPAATIPGPATPWWADPGCAAELLQPPSPLPQRRRTRLVAAFFAVALALGLAVGLPLLLTGGGGSEGTLADPQQAAHSERRPAPEPTPRKDEKTDPAGELLPVELVGPVREPAGGAADLDLEGPPPLVVLIPPTAHDKDDPSLILPLPPTPSGSVTVPADPNLPAAPRLTGPAVPNAPPALMPKLNPRPVVVKGPAAKAPGQDVTFMGAVGRGRRICIIADRSGSMKGTPILALKHELFKTLNTLRPESEFFVIFFASDATPQPVPTWLRGGAGVPLVAPFIQNAPAHGLTNPVAGFRVAFQLNPRPDVIFFMTDGVVTVGTPPDALRAIVGMNGPGPPIPVHSILFSHPGNMARSPKEAQEMQMAAALLRQISFHSGGTFSAVTLPPPMMGPPMPPPMRKK